MGYILKEDCEILSELKIDKVKSEFPSIGVKAIKFENIVRIEFEDICFEKRV